MTEKVKDIAEDLGLCHLDRDEKLIVSKGDVLYIHICICL